MNRRPDDFYIASLLAITCGLGACASHATTRAPSAVLSTATTIPARPWIDPADELGPVPEPEGIPSQAAWLPTHDYRADAPGLMVALDARRRHALMTTDTGIATLFDVRERTVRARTRFGLISEYDEAGWSLSPTLSRSGAIALLVDYAGSSSVVRRLDGSGVHVWLGSEEDATQSIVMDAALERLACLHRESGQLSMLHALPGGRLEERCRLAIPDSELAYVEMVPSGASVFLTRHPAGWLSPEPPTGAALRVDTETCATSVIAGPDVRLLGARPQGGQAIFTNGDRLEVRSPRDGRILGSMARGDVRGATYSDDGATIALLHPDERRTFVSALDGSPAEPFVNPSWDAIPEEVTALPRGEALVLMPLRFDADGSLLLNTRSDWGESFRSAVRIHAGGAEDACGPMADAPSRIAAIRRSLACLSDSNLRALDVSADGTRALVRHVASSRADGSEASVETVVGPYDPDEVVGDVYLYDVGAARMGSLVPHLDSCVYFGEPLGVEAALSPDGRRLVVGDQIGTPAAIRLLDAATGRVLAVRNAEGVYDVRFIDRSTVEAMTNEGRLRLRADRRLAVVGRPDVPGFDDRLQLPDGSALENDDDGFTRTTASGASRRFRGVFRALSHDGRFLVRCEGGALLLDRTDGEVPSARVGICPAEFARMVVRDDGRVVAITEGDRLELVRVETGESVELRIQVDGDRRTIGIADAALHVSILEGDADAFRIREAGDLLTAQLRPVVDEPEPRAALARVLSR